MNIGIDARLWNESGVGRYIRNLVEQLLIIDRKNSYSLFVLAKDKENIKHQISNIKKSWKLEIRNWKLIGVDIRWHTLEEQLRFPSVLYRESLDLVHFPYVSVPIFYNKPFVVTIHDLIPYHFPTGLATTLPLPLYKLKLFGYKFIISQAARKAKKIITVSNATKNEVVDHLKVNSNKIVVTYEGADSKISKIKYQISKIQIKNKKYFLYVGNSYPHKNLDNLIEAFDLLYHPEQVFGFESNRDSDFRRNDIKLVLVGKEDYFYKRLKEKVKNMGLEKSVLFYGEAADEELLALYKNALALIIASLMEGFGLPALEAMANGCLVLASDTPSLKEVCKDAAIYFDPYNVEDIAKKMKIIYSNDINHYSDILEKGLKRAKMFSWKKMAVQTLKVYENCSSTSKVIDSPGQASLGLRSRSRLAEAFGEAQVGGGGAERGWAPLR